MMMMEKIPEALFPNLFINRADTTVRMLNPRTNLLFFVLLRNRKNQKLSISHIGSRVGVGKNIIFSFFFVSLVVARVSYILSIFVRN